MTDSAAVKKWLNAAIEDERPLQSGAFAEMLIKRRIGVFKETMEAYGATVDMQLVQSHVNKADVLTRVPRQWDLRRESVDNDLGEQCAVAESE